MTRSPPKGDGRPTEQPMPASEFVVFGPLIGLQDGMVQVKLTGVDYDGTIYGETNSGEEISFEGNELQEARDDYLVMTKADRQAANSDLVSGLESLSNKAGSARGDLSNDMKRELQGSLRSVFQTVAMSAE